MHTPGSLLTNIKSHSMCEFSYKTCVLQFCLVQEGVGIIQAVEDGLICMHTVAADVSMTIVVAFGLLLLVSPSRSSRMCTLNGWRMFF